MVTPTSAPLPPSGDAPHLHREVAESFGSDAERYDRARPNRATPVAPFEMRLMVATQVFGGCQGAVAS